MNVKISNPEPFILIISSCGSVSSEFMILYNLGSETKILLSVVKSEPVIYLGIELPSTNISNSELFDATMFTCFALYLAKLHRSLILGSYYLLHFSIYHLNKNNSVLFLLGFYN